MLDPTSSLSVPYSILSPLPPVSIRFVYVCVFYILTFPLHAHRQALLEAAIRAAFPLGRVHRAALFFCTGVMLVILH